MENTGQREDHEFEALYRDLRALAAAKLGAEPPGATLSPTVLVHEAWLRLGEGHDEGAGRWRDRRHFYVSAAEAMRRILIDRARRHRAIRHGGEWRRTEFDDVISTPEEQGPEELLAVHEALSDLANDHPRKAELVKLRYFVGLTIEEAAAILEVSKSSAERDWTFARAWLFRWISKEK